MVDADSIAARLNRLELLLERLEEVREGGEDAYLADERTRASAERWLQLAVQACIDLGAQVGRELSVEAAADYAAVFRNLARAGLLEGDLANRLAAAARQRNLLVHLYMEIDDRQVFAALGRLDDLRAFAATVQALADAH